MAAVTFRSVMEAVAGRLSEIPGLRVSPYVPDQVNPPHAAVVMPEVENYHVSMGRGLIAMNMAIHLYVSGVDDRTGQFALAEYAQPGGDKSVFSALWADRRLGGAVSDCKVVGFRPLGRQDVNGAQLYVGEFSLLIHAPGM